MIPAVLLVLYLVEFTVLGIHPYDRGVWIAENAPIVGIVAALPTSPSASTRSPSRSSSSAGRSAGRGC